MGILYPGSPAYMRQEAYATQFGNLDVIGFSRCSDEAVECVSPCLRVIPTRSMVPLLYGWDAIRIAMTLLRPDVVSVQDPFETGIAAWFIARMYRVPLHVQVHTDFLSPEYARFSTKNRLRVWIAGFVLRRAVRVRVVSERIKKSIVDTYSLHTAVSVLPIFVDLARFKSAVALRDERFNRFQKKILVVSRLESEKDIARALRAYREVSPLGSCLIIVGEGSERDMLERLTCEMGIADRVFFEGTQDAAPYYAFADLVLVTSCYEGYGLVIVEALAAGKPVLSTDVGIAREAGAIIASSNDFAAALRAWSKDGPWTGVLATSMCRDFDEYVRTYCDDVVACAQGK